MHTDHVEIELGACEIKARKCERIEKTIPSNYRFKSTLNPAIGDLIQNLSWDSVNNLLHITLRENQEFDAFRWFGTINERHAATQKSSFVDFEADAIILTFLNSADIRLAEIKFRNLKLISHNVSLGGDAFGLNAPLSHDITIQYQDSQLLVQERDLTEEWDNKHPILLASG